MKMESTEDLTTYLKNAMDLEATIYSLEKAKKDAEKELKEPEKPYKSMPLQPKMKTYYKESPSPQQEGTSTTEKEKKGPSKFIIFQLIMLAFGLLLFYTATRTHNAGMGNFSILILIAVGVVCAVYFIFRMIIAQHDYRIERYYNRQKEYYKDLQRKEKEKYDEKMKIYKIECEKTEKAYEIQMNQYQHKLALYYQAKDAISQLDNPLSATKKTLKSLYEADVIYPKYRNLIAISTLYEYFASGRCTELTGPDGAYNLYESELRQNIIINRLDKIINQLEEIKANQYALYMELREGRKISQRISSDVSSILSEKRAQSQIEAVCMETTAKNTEAIKYISLLNSFKN